MVSKRVISVDILRGITIIAMILVNNPGTWSAVYPPLLHAEWHGLTPTDLIFPFFIFIVGISISYSYKNKTNSSSTYRKIIIRSLKLIGLGLFLSWFLPYFPFFKAYETVRLPGVLQRIGVVFFIAAILFLNFNWKQLIGITALLLVSYWLFLGFVPLPDGMLPTFERAANNWANYTDVQILGKHTWKADYDPEGLLSTIPVIATCLLGIFTGKFLGSKQKKKDIKLVVAGIAFLLVGYVWSIWFPLNKAIWSSSFVLVTAGWAAIILAIVYYLTDVRQLKFGKVFIFVGMNAITIFFLSGFIAKSMGLLKIGDQSIHSFLYTTIFEQPFLDAKLSSMLYAICVISFYVLLGFVMYRKKLFIKV